MKKKPISAKRLQSDADFWHRYTSRETADRAMSKHGSQASLSALLDEMVEDDLADLTTSIACSGYLGGEIA